MWPFSRNSAVRKDGRGASVRKNVYIPASGQTSMADIINPRNWRGHQISSYGRSMSALEQFRLAESNPIASAVVRDIAYQAATVRFYVKDDEEQPVWDHPITELLERMDENKGRHGTLSMLATSLLVCGDAYLMKVDGTLRAERPPSRRGQRQAGNRVRVPQSIEFVNIENVASHIDHENDIIDHYDITKGTRRFRVMPENIIHLRQHWPTMAHEGLSILQAAYAYIAAHNDILRTQAELLANGAIPPAILAVSDDDLLDEEGFQQILESVKSLREGGDQQGRLAVIRANASLLMTPRLTDLISLKQVEHLEGKIAMAFGYPPVLIRSAEAVTYENQEQAKIWLWENTIIPKVLEPLSSGLSKALGIDIGYDLSGTPIEAARVKSVWERQKLASEIQTVNERRRDIGEGAIPGGDVIFRNAALIGYDQDGNAQMGQAAAPSREEQAEAVKQALESYVALHKKQPKVLAE